MPVRPRAYRSVGRGEPRQHVQESSPRQQVTELLRRWGEGDEAARSDLVDLVYPELQRLAGRYLRSEQQNHTLNPTALVHEVYMRLAGAEVAWSDRVHFFAVAARVMRRVLVDHGRTRRRQKRGGGLFRVTLSEGLAPAAEPAADIVALDRALSRLADLDERKARAIELHFFAGMTYDQIAEALEVSTATVSRELRFAKAWLHERLTSEEPAGGF